MTPHTKADLNTNERHQALSAGLFFSILSILLLGLSIWWIPLSHSEYWTHIETRRLLFLQETGASVFYGAWVALIGLLIVGFHNLFNFLVGQRYEAVAERVTKLTAYLIILGLVSMLAGRYIANNYWAQIFDAHSYHSCSSSFRMTGKWAKQVWVAHPSLCTDQEVIRLLHSPRHNLDDVNVFIRENRLRQAPSATR